MFRVLTAPTIPHIPIPLRDSIGAREPTDFSLQ